MHLQLGDVLAGDAARAGKPQRNRVIDIFAGFRMPEADMSGPARLGQASGKRTQRGTGLRAAQSNDRNSGAPRRGCRGENRVGDVCGRRDQAQCFGGN